MADLLSIGKTGLSSAKTSIETAGHNLSNVNTEGYSRQRVIQTTNVPIVKSGLIQGTGVNVKGITRFHDQFVEKKLNSSISDKQFYEDRSLQLEQVENIFNEINSGGLHQILNGFYNAFRELANQPENETIRSVVRDNALLVVKDFRRIGEELNNISKGIDSKIEQEVSDINIMLHQVAKINKTLIAMEASGDETGDLRDQRDTIVRNLSKSFGIQTYEDNKGQFIINAAGIGTLVAGAQVQELLTARMGKDRSPYGSEGSVEVFFKERPTAPIGKKFLTGAIGSLVTTRNIDVANVKKEVDDIAYDFINTTNAIHRRGYVNRKIEEDPTQRTIASVDSKGKTTGINFFTPPTEREGTALVIDLSEDVKSDLSNIVTAFSPNAPGDNRISLAISKIQHEKIFAEGTKTIEEQFLGTVGKIGVQTGKARMDSEQSEGIWAQMKSLRERLSGVSIDEETANLMKFQHAYDASAKVMKTADEMFQTVLAIKR